MKLPEKGWFQDTDFSEKVKSLEKAVTLYLIVSGVLGEFPVQRDVRLRTPTWFEF